MHELDREHPLQRGLGCGHVRRRVLLAPRRFLTEGAPVPELEIDHPGLRHEVAVGSIDPVPGEPAGTDDFPFDAPVGVQRERQRRPGQRGAPLHERGPAHPAGGGHTGAAAGGLHEPGPLVAHLGFALDVGHREGGEVVAQTLSLPHDGRADHATARVAHVDDGPTAVDLDPGPQLVGEPKAVFFVQRLEIVDVVRGRVVVVGHTYLERHLHGPIHSFGRDPRQRCHRSFVFHGFETTAGGPTRKGATAGVA